MVRKRFDVEVPDGQHLGFSRDTGGAFRAHLFDNETNDLMGHAELFEPNEDEADSPNLHSAYMSDSSATDLDHEADWEEIAGALATLVTLAIIVAAAPHIKNWWNDKALPAITSTSNRIKSVWNRTARSRDADGQVIATELVTLSDPLPGDSSTEADAALEKLRARMSSTEARQRFVAALIARAFIEEQMRLLRNARIDDDECSLELRSTIKALTTQQVGDTINVMLEKDPTLLNRETLTELGKVLARGQVDGASVHLRTEKIKDVLRRSWLRGR